VTFCKNVTPALLVMFPCSESVLPWMLPPRIVVPPEYVLRRRE